MCVILPNFMPIDHTVAEIWPFCYFQDGGRPPSWICFTRVWTTHEALLMVFIAVQNLVGIGIVLLKICDFQYFSH